MLTDFEELQHTQIQLHLTGSSLGVPPKPKRTRKKRKCGPPVRIEASQRVDWPAASEYQNRSRFNVAEQLAEHTTLVVSLPHGTPIVRLNCPPYTGPRSVLIPWVEGCCSGAIAGHVESPAVLAGPVRRA